jgi:hypothetical protein
VLACLLPVGYVLIVICKSKLSKIVVSSMCDTVVSLENLVEFVFMETCCYISCGKPYL